MDFNFASFDEIAQELGTRLKAHRLRLDISQPELARKAGLSTASVSNFETTGKTSLDSFLRMVAALRLTKELAPLFAQAPLSIEDLEQRELKRKRAKRKPSVPAPGATKGVYFGQKD